MRKWKIKKPVGGQVGARRHRCSDCLNKNLNDLKWKEHVLKKIKENKRKYDRRMKKIQKALINLALTELGEEAQEILNNKNI